MRSEGTFEAVANWRHTFATGATLVAAWACALTLFESRWQRSALADLHRQPGGWAGVIVVVVLSAVVHEMLHAGAWMFFGRIPRQAIAVRPTWQVMGFAARVVLPIPMRTYRLGLATPFLLMGVLPALMGTVMGNGLFLAWALFFSLECFSDLGSLFATRHLSTAMLVLSHPTKLGCRLASGETPTV
jgi:hypothetical protein